MVAFQTNTFFTNMTNMKSFFMWGHKTNNLLTRLLQCSTPLVLLFTFLYLLGVQKLHLELFKSKGCGLGASSYMRLQGSFENLFILLQYSFFNCQDEVGPHSNGVSFQCCCKENFTLETSFLKCYAPWQDLSKKRSGWKQLAVGTPAKQYLHRKISVLLYFNHFG